jgi:hypothetical protein
MKLRAIFILTSLMVSASPLAMAAPATPEEADRLSALFKSILGTDADKLSVKPNGDYYDVTFDLPKKIKESDVDAEVNQTPLVIKLQDLGGGKWTAAQPAPFGFDSKQVKDGKTALAAGKIGAFTVSGTFDQTLGTFSEAKAQISDVSFSVTETGGKPDLNGFNFLAKSIEIDLNSGLSAPLAELANARFYIGLNDISGDIDIPPDGKNPMGVKGSFALAHTDRTLELKGTRPKALMKFIDWGKAHPDEKSQEAGRADLARILKESLPVFDSASFSSTLKGLTIDTPFGKAGLENVTADLTMNGVVAHGMARQVVTISGLTLPDGLPQEILPKFALELMPKSMSMDLKVTDYDLAAPAGMLLDHLEESGDEPSPEMEKLLLEALLPKGEATITLAPGSYVSPALTVKYEGGMVAGPEKMPFGTAIVSANGLDKVIELIKTAPKELELENGIYGILAAKGFGKQEADGAVTWKIETTREGAVSVNGVKMPGTGSAN